MNQPNESPSTQEQIESCTQYLLDRFDMQARMEQVHEWMGAESLTEALHKFDAENPWPLRDLMQKTARELCACSAVALVKTHGENWQSFYEEVSYE